MLDQLYAEVFRCLLLYLHGLKPVLSFTLNGKHMSYAYTHLTHKTIIDNINFMHLYYELIRVLKLITVLCLFRSPIGVTELIVIQNLYLNYGVYTCSEIPVVSQRLRNVYWYCRAYSCLIRNLFLYGSTCKYYKTYTGTSYLILVLRSIFLS